MPRCSESSCLRANRPSIPGARSPIESSTSSFRFTIEYALISSPSLRRQCCVRAGRQKAGAHTALTGTDQVDGLGKPMQLARRGLLLSSDRIGARQVAANSIARLGGSSDHSDLDEEAGNEVRAHRRPHRLYPRELLLVDRVERGEVSQVDEVNKARNDVVERCSGSLEHGLDVVEGLLGLFDQIVANHLARVRIEAALAGQEDPLTDRHTR